MTDGRSDADEQETTSNRIALYPGSFDGMTYGHLDLIQRARRLFDHLVVGIADNPRKAHYFTTDERLAQARACIQDWPNVEVRVIEGLTINTAMEVGARFILRGLRAVSDFEFEFQLAIMNQQLNNQIETIFLAPDPEYIFLSSSMVREIWQSGGDVSQFVPPPVLEAFKLRKSG